MVGLDPNFFVTEAKVNCLKQKLQGRTLYISAPLCRIITADQFAAVVGHELGHFKGNDTKFSKHFFPVYTGLAHSLYGLGRTGEGVMSLVLIPLQLMLATFLESFAVAENKLSRDRELIADREAVAVTNQRAFASALVKIVAFSPGWEGLHESCVATLKSGRSLVNTSLGFQEAARDNVSEAILEGLDEQVIPHPTDSHPPLKQRL